MPMRVLQQRGSQLRVKTLISAALAHVLTSEEQIFPDESAVPQPSHPGMRKGGCDDSLLVFCYDPWVRRRCDARCTTWSVPTAWSASDAEGRAPDNLPDALELGEADRGILTGAVCPVYRAFLDAPSASTASMVQRLLWQHSLPILPYHALCTGSRVAE